MAEPKFLAGPAGVTHVEQAAGMKRFGQAGAAGVVEIVPVVAKVISDCCQGGPSIYSFIARYGSFQCSDIDGIHGPFYRPAKVGGATVTFEPGARTAWHTHPLGQNLIVTAGCGWAQREGGPVEEIRPGDVIWFAPGEKHWHGATATTGMTHIAIQEKLDGKAVDWLEQVTDEQYRA